MAAVAYYVLERAIIAAQGKDSLLQRAVGRDLKGKASPALYLVAIPLAWLLPLLANAIFVGVALLWLVPDERIERALAAQPPR